MEKRNDRKYQVPDWVIKRMINFCTYQERTLSDVKNKLKTFHLQEVIEDKIIMYLKKESYLDEARFARLFASGKIRINKWGKIKIYAELQKKEIPEFFILQGLNEVDEQEYLKVLREVLNKKNSQLKEQDPFRRKQKLAKFAKAKGFEQDIVWRILNEQLFF